TEREQILRDQSRTYTFTSLGDDELRGIRQGTLEWRLESVHAHEVLSVLLGRNDGREEVKPIRIDFRMAFARLHVETGQHGRRSEHRCLRQACKPCAMRGP